MAGRSSTDQRHRQGADAVCEVYWALIEIDMAAPQTVTRKQVEDEPFIVWNEYVGILGMSDYHELTEIQRVAHLSFWYDSELQNGGHLQYFENHGDHRAEEVIRSLRCLGGAEQADVLSRAARQFRTTPRRRIVTVEEFVQTALEGEFDELDKDYYRCCPPMTELLKAYLAQHRDDFVVIVG
jgi:Domain of unknown function (DUF4375)